MRYLLTIPAVLLLMVSGCQGPTLNEQRSAIRGTGDLAVTVYLDEFSGDVVTERAEMSEVMDDLYEFTQTGDLAFITKDVLIRKLEAMAPDKYKPLVEQALDYIALQHVNVEKIGAANVQRLLAFFIGAKQGCTQFTITDGKIESEAEPSTPPASAVLSEPIEKPLDKVDVAVDPPKEVEIVSPIPDAPTPDASNTR